MYGNCRIYEVVQSWLLRGCTFLPLSILLSIYPVFEGFGLRSCFWTIGQPLDVCYVRVDPISGTTVVVLWWGFIWNCAIWNAMLFPLFLMKKAMEAEDKDYVSVVSNYIILSMLPLFMFLSYFPVNGWIWSVIYPEFITYKWHDINLYYLFLTQEKIVWALLVLPVCMNIYERMSRSNGRMRNVMISLVGVLFLIFPLRNIVWHFMNTSPN